MHDIRFHLPEINTWRLCHKMVSQQLVMEMVQAWEAAGYRFGCVCIDDGWTVDGRLGDWTPDPARFPDMRGLVDWIHARGYAARLWIAPCQVHPGTEICQRAQPSHLLHNTEGKPAFYTGLGTYRLDPRSPLAAEHIRQTMRRMVHDYGFDAFKVDFPPFLEPFDDHYKTLNFNLSDDDARVMVPNFYKLVREGVEQANPAVRICCAKDIANCQPHIQDTICGDFVNTKRTDEMLVKAAQNVSRYVEGHDIVPWYEMVWGGGSDTPQRNPDWHTGFIEFIAYSINYELKIEHSFQPFNYPNAAQIRTLTNLYGPRNRHYKVFAAGRKVFSTEGLQNAGVKLDHTMRLLFALEDDTKVTVHTGRLGTSALQWHARDLLHDRRIYLRGRNEYWPGNTNACRLEVDVPGGTVVELWHEGPPTEYYNEVYEHHIRRPRDSQKQAGDSI